MQERTPPPLAAASWIKAVEIGQVDKLALWGDEPRRFSMAGYKQYRGMLLQKFSQSAQAP
jgi:hypothetical protein